MNLLSKDKESIEKKKFEVEAKLEEMRSKILTLEKEVCMKGLLMYKIPKEVALSCVG